MNLSFFRWLLTNISSTSLFDSIYISTGSLCLIWLQAANLVVLIYNFKVSTPSVVFLNLSLPADSRVYRLKYPETEHWVRGIQAGVQHTYPGVKKT